MEIGKQQLTDPKTSLCILSLSVLVPFLNSNLIYCKIIELLSYLKILKVLCLWLLEPLFLYHHIGTPQIRDTSNSEHLEFGTPRIRNTSNSGHFEFGTP